MRKGSTTKVSTTLLVLLMGFSLVACGSSAPTLQPSVNNTTETSPVPEQKPEESDVIEAEGILTGWADPHTVEIRVQDKAMSFQVGEDLQKSLDDIDDEDSVRFKYVEKRLMHQRSSWYSPRLPRSHRRMTVMRVLVREAQLLLTVHRRQSWKLRWKELRRSGP